MVWSTADKTGVDRIIAAYQDWHTADRQQSATDKDSFLADLAYTLDSRRSLLPWRSFALLRYSADLNDLGSRLSRPVRASDREMRLGFVFTGQGAQWFAMGRELMVYDSFHAELESAGSYLKTLGCPWNVKGNIFLYFFSPYPSH